MKINNFGGKLADISAKKEALCSGPAVVYPTTVLYHTIAIALHVSILPKVRSVRTVLVFRMALKACCEF